MAVLALLASASGFMAPNGLAAPLSKARATCPAVPNILMTSWNDASLPVTYRDRQSDFMYGPESQTYIEGRQMMYGPYRDGYYGSNRDMVRDYDYRNRRLMNDPYRRDYYDGGYGGISRYGERNDYQGYYGDYGNRYGGYRDGYYDRRSRYGNYGPGSYNYGRLNNYGRGGRYDYNSGYYGGRSYGSGYYGSYDRRYDRYRGPGFGNEVDDYSYDYYDRGMVSPTNRYGPSRYGYRGGYDRYGDYDRYRSSEVDDYSYNRGYYDRY